MNHLRIASTLCWAYKMEDVLQIANRFELGGVEVWADHFWYYNSDPKQVNQIRKETGQKLTMHAASWDLNICALNQGIRKQSINEIKKSILLAEQIEADNITLHPGKMTLATLDRSIHMDLLFDALHELTSYGKDKGLTLSLELMETIPKEFVVSPNLINRVTGVFQPDLQTTFNVAHIPLLENAHEQWSQSLYVNKIHISDVNEHQLHIPFGDGILPSNILLKFLQMKDVPVVIEGFDHSVGLAWLRKNMQYIETFAVKKKEVAI
ncbi:sugar phosphate isomerase/epimerase family protein [Bacillus sp. FSL K6-3431]|uniref:sugar phosphate isomerase/epimerase family protein n=1 Tax=Bacillus sp. FSL K6-3431 TaxID=2921500 RepID=UPI0030FC5E73